MKSKVHSFVGHKDEVFQVQWSPFNESVSHTTHRTARQPVRGDDRLFFTECGGTLGVCGAAADSRVIGQRPACQRVGHEQHWRAAVC